MASINEKLNYINETKFLIKDKLNDLGSEIDNETTFREYADKIEDLYEEWPKTSDENTVISLNNTKKAKMNLQLKGNTSQFTTTGRNKINEELLKQDADYNTYNTTTKLWTTNIGYNGDYNRSILYNVSGYSTNRNANKIIDVKPNTTYTLKFYDATLVSYNLGYYDNEGIYISSSNSKSTQLRTFTTPENCKKLDIRRENPQTQLIFSKIMIVEGEYTEETIPSYEPYTGGIASPNSDYPQDIEIITGENTIKIEGKNLLNINKLTSEYADTTYAGYGFWAFKITNVLGKYTLSRQDNTMDSGNGYLALGQGKDIKQAYGNKSWLMHPSLSNCNQKMCTVNNTGDLWLFTSGGNTNIQNTIKKAGYLLLEKGNTASSYVQYEGEIYSINLGTIELCKIESYQDYIYKNNNKWYKKPAILKINSYNGETISTDYKSTTGSLTTGATIYYVNTNNNPDGIEITNATLITQLNNIEQAVSYNGQTNISQENDNLPFVISASALLKNSN